MNDTFLLKNREQVHVFDWKPLSNVPQMYIKTCSQGFFMLDITICRNAFNYDAFLRCLKEKFILNELNDFVLKYRNVKVHQYKRVIVFFI